MYNVIYNTLKIVRYIYRLIDKIRCTGEVHGRYGIIGRDDLIGRDEHTGDARSPLRYGVSKGSRVRWAYRRVLLRIAYRARPVTGGTIGGAIESEISRAPVLATTNRADNDVSAKLVCGRVGASHLYIG